MKKSKTVFNEVREQEAQKERKKAKVYWQSFEKELINQYKS